MKDVVQSGGDTEEGGSLCERNVVYVFTLYRDTCQNWSPCNVGSVQQCCEFWKMEFDEELGTWNLVTAGFSALNYGPLSLQRGFVWVKFSSRRGCSDLRRGTNI